MEISVSKKEIFDEVEKRSSLEGMALPERFEGVWASEEEGKFLDSYWVEGCTAVVQLMKRYLTSETVEHGLSSYDGDEKLSISATMPKRYSSLLDGNVATDVKMLLACNILHGWLEVKAPDAAAKYDEEAKGYSEDLRVKLLYRTEPKGTMVAAESDSKKMDVEMKDALKRNDMPTCEMNIYPAYEYINEGRRDDSKLRAEEESLKSGRTDDVSVKAEEEGLKSGRTDDVVLVQQRGECEGRHKMCRQWK